ncbi:hypothetical protein Tco_1279162, partial [Tanacetum coccineum]
NKSEKSVCDNGSTSNPSEPSSKWFSISTSLLGRERSLDNNSYIEEYDCSSLALDLKKKKKKKGGRKNSSLETRSRYVSDQDMCFRKKGRREKNGSEKIRGKRFCFSDGVA